ncbi:hypothetical protein O4H52_01585 [Sphingomonadaceae bacterium G21617-S1]|nr:hypothetical protein [Sphingomonadaceae bacterium G21617-S1]
MKPPISLIRAKLNGFAKSIARVSAHRDRLGPVSLLQRERGPASRGSAGTEAIDA